MPVSKQKQITALTGEIKQIRLELNNLLKAVQAQKELLREKQIELNELKRKNLM